MYPTGSLLRSGLLALLVFAMMLPTACGRDVQKEPEGAKPIVETEAQPEDGTGPQDEPRVTKEHLDERYQVAQEERKFHAAQLVQEGREYFTRGENEKALSALTQARYLDKDNQEVAQLLERVAASLDQRQGAIQDQERREQARRMVALEQAKIRAQSLVKQGEVAEQEGDFQGAIEHYEDALNIAMHGPYGVDMSMDVQDIEGRLRAARENLKQHRLELEQAVASEAMERKSEEEAVETQKKNERIQRLMLEANRNFQLSRFDESEKYLDYVLKLAEPESEYAKEADKLKSIVRESRHQLIERKNKRQMSEQWKRVFEDLKFATLLPTKEIEVPANWAETVGRRTAKTLATDTRKETEEDRIIKRRLESISVTLSFEDDTQFSAVIDYFHKITSINFVISKGVHEKLSEGSTLAGINTTLPLKNALELVLDMIGGLKYKVEDGLVRVIMPEEAKADTYLDFYNVKDLVNPVRDFPGIEINLNPSGAEAEEEMEEDGEGNRSFDPDRLVDLVKGNIAKQTWDEDPAAYSAQVRNGIMIVKHSAAVHGQITTLLDGLRKSASIMVSLEARFLIVEDNFLEDIGVDFRGLGDDSQGIGEPGRGTDSSMDDFGVPGAFGGVGTPTNPRGPGTDGSSGIFYNDNSDGDIRARTENLYDSLLGNPKVLTGSGGLSMQLTYLDDTEVNLVLRAVRKSERMNMVTAPRITVFNTERANVTVLNQVSYIKDFDAEIAQAAAITEPVVDVIQDGVVLDVRPIVSADRRYITMDLRPTVAQLLRPIPTVTASVATGTPVTIELPRLEVQRVRTTVTIPDNATVLLGGLKFSEEQDKFSGIPILSKIPILSFLTSRRGKYTNRRNLLILLKASILIPEEVVPRAGIEE